LVLIWIYSIGIEFNKKIPEHRKLNKIILIALIAYPIIYIPIGMTLLISGIADMNTILPFHFGAMICMFLLIILTSITIIKFEKAEKLKQSNGIGLFFGIWCFIIGIWYIQPKLNKYIKRIK
jgi:zinc transporter ZupT